MLVKWNERNTDLKKHEKLLNSLRDNIFIKLKYIKIMPKKEIHPKWYPESKVYCDGQLIMTVGSTRPELNVDIWSGNHPFYTGTQRLLDSEGRVERFMRKYGMSSSDTKNGAQK
jgi:large subunit ribosomal protein L31